MTVESALTVCNGHHLARESIGKIGWPHSAKRPLSSATV